MDIIQRLSDELNVPIARIEATVKLIDDGNTIPFIARYRKEVTGSLDDTTLRNLNDRLTYLRNLDKRREEVRESIISQEKMTEEIAESLEKAETLAEIEDIYRPYKPHRKTRADAAREKGLQPLADIILEQSDAYETGIAKIAERFVDPEKGVDTPEDAVDGACDIIAEGISDNAEIRKSVRELSKRYGVLRAEKKGEDEAGTYANYYEFNGKIHEIPGYRLLALNRAEKEEVLGLSLDVPEDVILNDIVNETVSNPVSPAAPYLMHSAVDGYERLIAPSIERELRSDKFDEACEGAIKVFSENLRHLLLTPPLRGKTVLGLDPGYRTGCKLAVVDPTGKVLDTAVIYPTLPRNDIQGSERIVSALIKKHGVDYIAIGNGTASKESEIFISNLIKKIPERNIKYSMVSEAGASVYSASKLAAEEFPDFDVTQRSAVSIARRLQDALSELVKIDPKSIGVGQYQHDMKPARLNEALGGVVESCVNSVGVDLNTASRALLSYVSGLNSASAKNIVSYREENGAFRSRKDLLNVPRIGAKAYEQCAGFVRVPDSEEPLDNTGVHPTAYDAAYELIKKLGHSVSDVRNGGIAGIGQEAQKYGLEKLSEELGIGVPTLNDVLTELEKPGRDVRDEMPLPELRDDVMDLNDLKPGMSFTGTVRNVTDFGAFVDIGVHQDGLVHISKMSKKRINHPSEILSVGDRVSVTVLDVDQKRKRISLTMIQ